MGSVRLPLLVRGLMALVPAADRELIRGDLMEVHARRLTSRSAPVAWLLTMADAMSMLAVHLMMDFPPSRFICPVVPGQLRQTLRETARRPAVAATVVVALALGIGANTAIFSILHAVVLSPLPYPDADRLVYIESVIDHGERELMSGPEIVAVRSLNHVFEHVAEVKGYAKATFRSDGPPEQFRRMAVSWDYFRIYGAQAEFGRTFEQNDQMYLPPDVIGDGDAAWPVQPLVISHGLWLRKFGGDSAVIGSVHDVNGRPSQIIGVMPAGFRALGPAEWGWSGHFEAWYLSPYDPAAFPRDTRFVRALAKLQPGVRVADARAALDLLAAEQRSTFPIAARDDWRTAVTPLHETVTTTARTPLLLFLAGVGLVLLIACANVATILLARSTERLDAVRVRRALGASRTHLISLALGESLILGAVGTAAGLFLAWWGTGALLSLGAPALMRIEDVGLNPTVLLFTTSTGLGAALLGGLLPAVWGTRGASTPSPSGTRLTGSTAFRRLGSALVIAEVGAAVVLTIGGGLLVRSFTSLTSVEPGFETAGILTGRVQLLNTDYGGELERVDFYRRVMDVLGARSDVESVGVIAEVPLESTQNEAISVHDVGPEPMRVGVDIVRILPGALEVLGVSMMAGRSLGWGDMGDPDHLVAVVDQTMAETIWGEEDPVGRTVQVTRRDYLTDGVVDVPVTVEIIGVAASVRARSLRSRPAPTMWVSKYKNTAGEFTILARGPAGRVPDLSAIVEAVAAVDPSKVVFDRGTMHALVRSELAQLTFALKLVGLLGGLGILLAVIGVYGLLSFTVGQRTRELHIRAALGATAGGLRRLVLSNALVVVGAGVVLGWFASAGVSGFLGSFLYGVGPVDLVTYGGVAILVLFVALVAAWSPGQRAGTTDPAAALRGD